MCIGVPIVSVSPIRILLCLIPIINDVQAYTAYYKVCIVHTIKVMINDTFFRNFNKLQIPCHESYLVQGSNAVGKIPMYEAQDKKKYIWEGNASFPIYIQMLRRAWSKET